MRPNQQNNKNRSRGRNNNNGGRKHLNPLSRNYESNGPDVKVRGNASHVAEKYLQLARDAQSSGDSVMAENYLQHAEHYFRIVAAAQQQLNPQRDQPGQTQNDNNDDDDDDDFPPINDRFASPEPPASRLPPPQQQSSQPDGQQASPQAENNEAAAPAPAEAAAAEGGDGEGDGPRRHRERRGRRRRTPGEAGGVDAAGASQPDVGELPAFLTATPAAE